MHHDGELDLVGFGGHGQVLKTVGVGPVTESVRAPRSAVEAGLGLLTASVS